MANPKQILELEKYYGIRLKEVDCKEILIDWEKGQNSFLLNEQQQIIGLSLRSNQISDTSFLRGLKQLQSLDLSVNQINDYSFLQGLTQLQSLYLIGNQISDTSFLKGLTQLQSLNLHYNLISDASFLKGLKQLHSLDLSSNEISDASFLKGLKQLHSLDLSYNQISDVSFLKGLKQLYSLSLSHNQISDVSFLKGLKQTKVLDLSYNQIIKVHFLKELPQIEALNLSYNRISDVSFLKRLMQLKALNLFNNQISDVSFLHELIRLKALSLSENKISDIPFLQGLKQLETLDLSYNQISDASLKGLIKLKTLNLSKNQISDVSFLKDLKQLQALYLRHNQISDVSFLKDLKQLQSLDLRHNQISELTWNTLCKLEKLNSLKLSGNPIENIPQEILSANYFLESIRNYLEDLEKGKSKNKILKLIFIGNGNVGKTQIVSRLSEQENFVFNRQHDSTHAIALLRRDFEGVELQMWDFAGQDIYHATHRLFMQTRALFVLVWDWENEQKPFHLWQGKNYKNEKLLYWLEYAKCFGQDSPILVLQNKVDTPEDAQKGLMQRTRQYYQKHYPILDFVQVSAKTGRGFATLEDILEEKLEGASSLQAFLNQELPDSWIAVRSAIESLQGQGQGQKTMEFVEFKTICTKHAVVKSATTICTYLHDTGVLYRKSNYFNGKIILNQSWVIEAIYKILNRTGAITEILTSNQGKLNYRHLCKIWGTHSDVEKKLFIDFMLSTELCFETTEKENEWEYKPLKERSFVVPTFLPKRKPSEVDFLVGEYLTGEFAPSIRRRKYKTVKHYRFLPSVFIQRFIVAANRLSRLDLIWQQGIWLETNEGEAIVEADYKRREIVIQANTRQLVLRIEKELEKIAGEGKVKAQYQINDSKDPLQLQEKYMQGLKGLHYKSAQSMKPPSISRLYSSFNQDKSTSIEYLAMPSTNTQESSKKQKFLFLAANPTNESRMQTDREYRIIKAELERGRASHSFDFLIPQFSLTMEELLRAMTDKPEIIHFAGHGTSRGIVMVNNENEAKLISTAILQRLFRRLKGHTQAVLLNACNSSTQAKIISQFGMYVIGNNVPVDDNAAVQFAKGFYLGLSDGKTIEEAFDDAMIFLMSINPNHVALVEVWKDGKRLDL